jgi:uncharacterized protein (TIGR02594 family)
MQSDTKKGLTIPPQIDLFLTAAKYIGTKEIPGQRHNKLIVEWGRRLARWVMDDELPWCSNFLNAMAEEAGYEQTRSMAARSWNHIGEAVDNPQVGDLVVLWRVSPISWQGHVGIYVSHNEHSIYVLGGNQNNQVNVSPYPIERLLSYRRLKKIDSNKPQNVAT